MFRRIQCVVHGAPRCRCSKTLLTCKQVNFSGVLAMSTNNQSSKNGLSKEDVKHDEDENEFYINLTEGSNNGRAFLQYTHIRPDYVDLQHTVVPPEFRGKGIAKVLAETVFDYFVEKNIRIRPTCTYLQKFYNDNPLPQYTDKVKWD